MQVTDVRVRPITGDGRVKAVCTILIDGVFAVHDIRVIVGNNGFFISMPSRKTPEGEYKDLAHPITSDTRELIQKAVLTAYHQALMDKAGD